MNQTVKKKWVEALRSDRYDQTRGYLKYGSCFCVLGVLCDIVDPNGWKPYNRDSQSWRGEAGVIPSKLCSAIHLKGKDAGRLMQMNDGEGKTFKELADYIENNL